MPMACASLPATLARCSAPLARAIPAALIFALISALTPGCALTGPRVAITISLTCLRQTSALAPTGVMIGLSIRSEEHTSELQSRGHLVCRLLLEKKNNQ